MRAVTLKEKQQNRCRVASEEIFHRQKTLKISLEMSLNLLASVSGLKSFSAQKPPEGCLLSLYHQS